MRLKTLRLITFFFLGVIACHLFFLQVIRGPFFFDLSKNNRIRVVALEGKRGRILDRRGVVLADNRKTYNVSLVPQEIKDSEGLFTFLGDVLDEKSENIRKWFEQRRFAPFAPVVIKEDIDRDTVINLEENKFRFPGLLIEESFRRVYRFGESDAHVLGYVGRISQLEIQKLRDYGYTPQSVIGKAGVEKSYDNFLRGEEGGLQIEVNSRGQQVRLLSLKDPQEGEDITLTIDERVQQIAAELLSGRSGAIIVLDVKTGEIFGMSSSPTYDPNVFVRRMKDADAAYLFSSPLSPLFNRVVSGQYPPGSVFKIPVAVAALEARKITPSTTFMCPGYYVLGQTQFRCSHIHGSQDLAEAIAHSCNVYFYHTGLVTGPYEIGRQARVLGLGVPTNIDLPYEASGFIPGASRRKSGKNQDWYKGDTLNLSIGQGDVLVTPLQLVRMMTLVAGEGREVHPHVVKFIEKTDIAPRFASTPFLKFNEKILSAVQNGLKNAVQDSTGTAHGLDIEGLSIIGKTGTAQTSGSRDHHAWFVGVASSARNKLAFCVFLEFGGSSANAVPIARELLLRLQQAEIL